MDNKNINLDKYIPILNPKQAAFYWSKGIEPIDIYPSIDSHTQQPIVVFLLRHTRTLVTLVMR